MNKTIKITIALIIIIAGFFAGNLTVDHFSKDEGICISEEFSDNDYYLACKEGCNQLGIIYEVEFNITQDFDAFIDCSKVCLDKLENKSS